MRRRPVFAATALAIAVVMPRPALGQQPGVPRQPGPAQHIGSGALIGAAALTAIPIASTHACRAGCEASGPGTLLLMALAGATGAGIGAGLGYLADRYAAPSRTRSSNRYFPDRPAVRLGSTYGQTTIRSPLLEGRASGPGLSIGFDVSPYISAHVDYTSTRGTFTAAPGAIASDVLSNVVPATSRAAGRSFGTASQRIDFVLSELIGIHPRPWGRLRMEFLAGLGVRGGEERSYYEQLPVDGTGELTGKYYILNFESPNHGIVLGADVEVVAARGFSIVPSVRYQRLGNPGPALYYGVGAHWRF